MYDKILVDRRKGKREREGSGEEDQPTYGGRRACKKGSMEVTE